MPIRHLSSVSTMWVIRIELKSSGFMMLSTFLHQVIFPDLFQYFYLQEEFKKIWELILSISEKSFKLILNQKVKN